MPGERILVVDDNATNLKLVRIVLQEEGYTVDAAASAKAALDSVRAARPQLILMDLQLPGMDGFALTRLLRQDPTLDDTPILALTAFAMKGDEDRARSAGCDGYLTKPFELESLAAAIRELLAAPRQRR